MKLTNLIWIIGLSMFLVACSNQNSSPNEPISSQEEPKVEPTNFYYQATRIECDILEPISGSKDYIKDGVEVYRYGIKDHFSSDININLRVKVIHEPYTMPVALIIPLDDFPFIINEIDDFCYGTKKEEGFKYEWGHLGNPEYVLSYCDLKENFRPKLKGEQKWSSEFCRVYYKETNEN